jgi:hypothetical protein
MGDMSHYTVLQVLETIKIFADDSANQDCTVPFETFQYSIAWKDI